ncbi:RraA family protein [Arenibaculum sp.]|jgi:regulator of RNase E activity RraA|uniref:RraA family protein n=1 Tax=Arenibaculum sp. TaxID=2865862 RepID=UPI002E0DD8CE|nr:RraA family protein [Arenibaculum sp.]
MTVDESVLAALRALDTPTVCNAIEVLAPERRGRGYTTRPLVSCTPQLGAMVGHAVTGTLRAMHPSGLDKAEQRERRLAWYRYVEASPRPSVVVIQDLDSQPGYGSFWGEVNTAVHQGLGAAGVVTDGSVRDLDACAEGFHMLAGLVAPSHAWVRIEEFGIAVTVAGMTVRPGDLVHADRHGAVVVPHAIAADVPAAAAAIARGEAVIIEAARKPGFTVDALAEAMLRRDDIH